SQPWRSPLSGLLGLQAAWDLRLLLRSRNPFRLRRGGDSRARAGLDAAAGRGPDGDDEAVASESADCRPCSPSDGGTLLRRLGFMALDAGGGPRRPAHVSRTMV